MFSFYRNRYEEQSAKETALGIAAIVVMFLFLMFTDKLHAEEITVEANAGRQGEFQLRVGPTFVLSDHVFFGKRDFVLLDTGLSAIKYDSNHVVGVVDATFLYGYALTGNLAVVVGTGPALWTQKKWGHEDSATLWTFSNKLGLEYALTGNTEAGCEWRHYSDLAYTPNTSKDFVGCRVGTRF